MSRLLNRQESKLCILIILFLIALQAIACSREDVQFYQMEPNSIVIVPDIQIYTMNSNSKELSSIVDFINTNKSNISLCLQTGDLTNNNTPEQWNNAFNEYVNKLHPDVTHFECLGNHDYGDNGSANERVSNISWDISANSLFSFGKYNENYVKFVQIAGKEYGVLVLEFAVRDTTIEWAQQVLNQYSDMEFIVLTHAFLNSEGYPYGDSTIMTDIDNPKFYGLSTNDRICDSECIFDKICNSHPNVKYMVCGHSLPKDGLLIRTKETVSGDIVKLIMVNFQHYANGGDGNFVILNTSSEQDNIYIHTPK